MNTPHDTKADLEQVYRLLEQGWCQYRTGHLGHTTKIHGLGGGCLGDKMLKVAHQGLNNGAQAAKRYDDMAEALGFGRPMQDRGGCLNLGSAVTNWNDFDADWDTVKERVKKTIGEL